MVRLIDILFIFGTAVSAAIMILKCYDGGNISAFWLILPLAVYGLLFLLAVYFWNRR